LETIGEKRSLEITPVAPEAKRSSMKTLSSTASSSTRWSTVAQTSTISPSRKRARSIRWMARSMIDAPPERARS
jgi:hypothetical protein